MSKAKKPITITLDRERTILYTFKGLEALEREGINPFSSDISTAIQSPLGLKLILWAGLIHEDPELKPDQLSELLDLRQISKYADLVGKALTESMPS